MQFNMLCDYFDIHVSGLILRCLLLCHDSSLGAYILFYNSSLYTFLRLFLLGKKMELQSRNVDYKNSGARLPSIVIVDATCLG